MGSNISRGAPFIDILMQDSVHIVMLGLDSAGKTTALYRLKFDQYLNTVPTIGFNCERIKGIAGKAKGVSFLIWDVGGQEKLRSLWKSYTRGTDGIVFIVDCIDHERMEEAKFELLRTAMQPENSEVPLLILANKQDLPNAKLPNEMEKLLGLDDLGMHRIWHIQPSCAITGEGLDEGLEILYNMIIKSKKKYKTKKKSVWF